MTSSVRIDDGFLQSMKANAHQLQLSQTDYIRKAIEYMNSETEKQERRKRVKNASLRVRKESMKWRIAFEGQP